MVQPPPTPSLLETLGNLALAVAAMLAYFLLREFGRGWRDGGAIRAYRRREERRDGE